VLFDTKALDEMNLVNPKTEFWEIAIKMETIVGITYVLSKNY
jgi:hypothetical protein